MVFLQLSALVVVFIIYKTVSSLLEGRRFNAFARQNACAEVPELSGPVYTRFDRLRRVMRLKKSGEDILDDIIGEDLRRVNTVSRKGLDGSRMLNTIEPANIKAILATQFKEFETGHVRYRAFSPMLGRSIFTSDGAFWEHSRALFRPQFSRDNINDLDSTDQAANALIQALGPTDSSGWTSPADLMPLLFNFTLDTATHFLFGESVNSQASAIEANGGKPIQSHSVAAAGTQATSINFADDLAVAGDYSTMRIRLGSLSWMYDSFRFRKAVATIKQFTEYFAQRAIEAARSGKDEDKHSLLARLATQTQDQEELRDQTLAILFAGRDTTAALLGWCFLRLALHPDILQDLRSVIMKDFVPGEPITFEKLKSCRPLQFFLNEVLRLHPTVPLNARVANKDTTLPTGGGLDQRSPVAVRKGETVGFSVYLMHRRKDLWGEDALEFKPERWEQRVPAWQFLPFNGGPRICLGQQFAMTEASYVIVRMSQHFDRVEPVDKAEMLRMKKGLGLTMWPGDGVKLRLHKA